MREHRGFQAPAVKHGHCILDPETGTTALSYTRRTDPTTKGSMGMDAVTPEAMRLAGADKTQPTREEAEEAVRTLIAWAATIRPAKA